MDICERDERFLFIIISGPAGLALKCAPLSFQIFGHAPEFVVAVKTHDFVSGVFVTYLVFFKGRSEVLPKFRWEHCFCNIVVAPYFAVASCNDVKGFAWLSTTQKARYSELVVD